MNVCNKYCFFFHELCNQLINFKSFTANFAHFIRFTFASFLKSAGKHEAEISFSGESDLQKSLVICSKNPNHTNFIPVSQFSFQSLPRKFRDKDVYACVRKLISLCVRLRVSYTSESRPPGYDFSEKSWGSSPEFVRYGSGAVYVPKHKSQGLRCPLCKDSPTPRKKCYFVWASTALHVVYDNLEAAATEVDMYFDDDKKKKVRKLQGLSLVNASSQGDRCILECVTHDYYVYKHILSTRRHLRRMEDRLSRKYANQIKNGVPPLAVIVSHPHGCYKQISFGTKVIKERVEDNCPTVEWTEYRYNAATCRGSSGALVWLLGQTRVGYRDDLITVHTHSGAVDEKLNTSGRGLDFVKHAEITHHTAVPPDGEISTSHWSVSHILMAIMCLFLILAMFELFSVSLFVNIFCQSLYDKFCC